MTLTQLCSKKVVRKINKHIFLSSVNNERDDYFFVVVNRKILARIYLLQGRWYIWYEKASYRLPVESFTAAVNLIEQEIMRCVE